MLNPMRDKYRRHVPRGRRDDTCDHGLFDQKIAEGKISYELSWKVKVMIVIRSGLDSRGLLSLTSEALLSAMIRLAVHETRSQII